MAGTGESLSKDLTPEEFIRFRDYIHQHSGIYLEEQKADSLRISLVARATRFQFASFREYHNFLITDEEEFRELINLITVNETSFFRFPAQFEALRDEVIPEIVESKHELSRQFRVWSAGCSTGEEPYSLGMTILDSGLEPLGYDVQVMGTDVSSDALLRAKRGLYSARSLLSVPHSISSRFFEPTPEGHRVVDGVRKHVTFQYHNLIKEPYASALSSSWDIIFCRNVTIYFRSESTRRVVDNFYESLNPGGYLFIGHSETLTSISDRFEPVEVGGVFLYRKPMPRQIYSFSEISAQRKQKETARPKKHVSRPRSPRPSEKHVQSPDSNNAEALLRSAYAHTDTGDMEAAIKECHRAIAINPLLAGARYTLGIIYLQEENSVQAVSEFKKTIYIDPGFVLAYFNLANLHRQNGAFSDACREYENALRTLYESPDGAWTMFMGGFQPDLLAKACEHSLLECRSSRE